MLSVSLAVGLILRYTPNKMVDIIGGGMYKEESCIVFG
jgi:hypothetical protein